MVRGQEIEQRDSGSKREGEGILAIEELLSGIERELGFFRRRSYRPGLNVAKPCRRSKLLPDSSLRVERLLGWRY